jgi:hypothetical protein
MSKDPAVLFYTSDFLTGTMIMSDDQVGKYIRLLCLQHQHRRLTEKHMLYICKTYDADIWAKFEKDDEGYYNARMDEEAKKRASYTATRRNNASKKKNKAHDEPYVKAHEKHMLNHMENENENRNEDVIKNKDVVKKEKKTREKFVPPTLDEVRQFAESEMIGSKELPEKFFYHYEANGWMINKVPMKNWQAAYKNWNKRESNGTYQQPIPGQFTGQKQESEFERWKNLGTDIEKGRRELAELRGFATD